MMPLAKRIIPSILVRGKTAYKGVGFKSDRSIGSAAAIVRVQAARGADEVILLDIAATAEGRGPDLDLVRELSESVFIPLTVGGGVRTLKDIDALLRAGADKVAICTGAWEMLNLIKDASDCFGNQAIVVVLEYDETCSSRNATEKQGEPVLSRAIRMESEGAGEIVLSNTRLDGTLQGMDLTTIREVSNFLNIPVVASGGCGSYEHMLEAFGAGADAVATGAMLAFTDAVPREAAKYLVAHGIEVRIP
jgi:cyclase